MLRSLRTITFCKLLRINALLRTEMFFGHFLSLFDSLFSEIEINLCLNEWFVSLGFSSFISGSGLPLLEKVFWSWVGPDGCYWAISTDRRIFGRRTCACFRAFSGFDLFKGFYRFSDLKKYCLLRVLLDIWLFEARSFRIIRCASLGEIYVSWWLVIYIWRRDWVKVGIWRISFLLQELSILSL